MFTFPIGIRAVAEGLPVMPCMSSLSSNNETDPRFIAINQGDFVIQRNDFLIGREIHQKGKDSFYGPVRTNITPPVAKATGGVLFIRVCATRTDPPHRYRTE